MTRNSNIVQTDGDEGDDSYQIKQKFPVSAFEGSRQVVHSGSNLQSDKTQS